ncbi:hypothetical protein [Sulfoacidibacillus thermotolerans]|uniref:hypothetical protein n=1 Tax=Sulfoacidibacillus thermotolerans TaxID=1765684 RepID=UPI0015E804A9|nr:hypothetical protein [Sulfoacidibacillus thermotolerans]
MKLIANGIVFLTMTYAMYLLLAHVNENLLFDLSGSAGISPLWRHIAAYLLAGP